MYFDVRAAKLLQPGGHLLVEGCAGLRLVVSASRKTWTYRYKAADGRMKQVSIGQWSAMPVQEAAARWRVLADGKSAGVDPAQEKRQARALQGAPAADLPWCWDFPSTAHCFELADADGEVCRCILAVEVQGLYGNGWGGLCFVHWVSCSSP